MPLILDTPPSEKESELYEDVREERRRVHHEADVVVVGAGILGSAIATTFARQGRSVILLEKSLKEPDRIVGELLQPGGVAALQKLGLRDCLEDIDAVEVHGYECFYYGEPVMIPYPAEKDTENVWHGQRPQGRSFHHGRFVQKLRGAAMREPNVSIVESTAVSLVKSNMNGQVLGVECKTRGEKDFYFGHLTIVADGYRSIFRNHGTESSSSSHSSKPRKVANREPVAKSKFYGLELHDCPLPAPKHGHVILGSQAPVLLYQIGEHETRVLVDVPTNTPSASVANGGVKGHLRREILPTLPAQVQPSFDAALQRAETPQQMATTDSERVTMSAALKSMPNSFLASTTNSTPGLLILGDALNMRHPLTGGGMTVALNDVLLLSKLLDPTHVQTFADSARVLRILKTFHWQRKNLSSVINILAQALYTLFAANDEELRVLQMGCFRYFQRGGECLKGPTGLLAGLTPQPLVLFYHFFSVALLGIWIYILQGMPRRAPNGKPIAQKTSILTAPMRSLKAPSVFWKACIVIFPYIFAELQT
ncbi:MAG: hypothetical protein Q9162_004951 [Coniocarpon cinnabarinum]